MASQHTHPTYSAFLRTISAWVGFGLFVASAQAQTAISAWTLNYGVPDTTSDPGAPAGYTFNNDVVSVTNFTAGTTKTTALVATSSFVRRSSTGGSANVWLMENNGTQSTTLRPSYGNNLNDYLLDNNVLKGANDIFTNSGGSPTSVNSNVERVDFYFAGGFTGTSDMGFAVFERGTAGAFDGFKIAVFTGVDGAGDRDLANAGTPTDYSGRVITITNANYSSTALAANYDGVGNNSSTETTFNATFLRYIDGNGDNLTGNINTTVQGTTNQELRGVFISLADLNINSSTVIYGYSIMAPDVNVTNATIDNLVNWANTSVYFNNTADTSSGSIDPLAVGGRVYVPEPSTYGAMFLGLGSAFLGLRRWRQNRGAV